MLTIIKKLRSVFIMGLSIWLAILPFQAHALLSKDAAIESAEYLVQMNLLKGRLDGDLALNDSITRAEFVTFVVGAYGKTEEAIKAKGTAAFPDTNNHWASGYIAVAKRMMESNGEIVGMTDGRFSPNGKLTAAEAIAFLMKFMNVKADSNFSWPDNYLLSAIKAGLVAEVDKSAVMELKKTPITRGTTFYLLDQAFRNYMLPDGKNFYDTYVSSSSGPVDEPEQEAPEANPNLLPTAPIKAANIHAWNYYTLTDDVRATVRVPSTTVRVYADEARKQLLGRATGGDGASEAGSAGASEYPVTVPIEKGLTSGNLYITVTEPGKRESAITELAIDSHPKPPLLSNISNSKYTLFVSGTPSNGYVLIYDSMTSKKYLGRGDNTKKNAQNQTEAFLYDGSALSSKSDWYIALYVNGSESERVKYTLPEPEVN